MAKKIVIGIIVSIVFLLALLTVLPKINKQSVTRGPISGDTFSSGVAMPGRVSMGLPLGMPTNSSSDSVANKSMMAEVAPSMPNVSDVIDKKVIKNGDLEMNVSNIDQAASDVSRIARENGGEVFSSNFYQTPSKIKSGFIVVKVPVANFGKTFADIKKVASLVARESTSGQDVTEQYSDLQAQLRNRQAEEQQYLEILKQAQKIQDILDVTRQLSQVRGQIEQLQGQIKYLDSQTDMSSITVNMTEDSAITVTDAWRPWQVAKDAVNSLIKKAQGFVNFAIVLLITVIPVALLYLLLIYIIYRIGRWIYFRFIKKPEQAK